MGSTGAFERFLVVGIRDGREGITRWKSFFDGFVESGFACTALFFVRVLVLVRCRLLFSAHAEPPVYPAVLDDIFGVCACDIRRSHEMTPAKTKEDLEREKRVAAETVARWIPDGARIGIGSGTTSAYFIRALGARVREEGLRVSGIPTSIASEELARSVGIPLLEPASGLRLDFTVDGADEITPELHLIKGGGGKLFREKVIATASRFLLVIADSSKPVRVLGTMPLPVEVIPFSAPWVADRIAALGGSPIRREHEGVPAITDQGNWLFDCHFRAIPDPALLDSELKRIPGVLENGLFLGLAKLAVVADGDTAMLLRPGATPVSAAQFDALPPIA